MKIMETKLPHPHGFTRRSKTDMIVMHHAAAKSASVETINQWHNGNGWNGIGYHYYVRKDGSVYRGRPEWALGSHAKGSNDRSIGICCEGDYMVETMPAAQLASVKALLRDIMERWGKLVLRRHRDVSATDCPGDKFPWAEVQNYETEDEDMTRQEVQAMIDDAIRSYARGEGETPSAWAADAWDKAKDAGVTDGTRPGAPMTREMGVVMMQRAGLLGK